MDPQVEKAYQVASIVATLSSQIRILNEEYNQTLLYYFNGGTFTANEQRLAFLFGLVNKKIESIVLLDDNQTPILVDDIKSFTTELLARYKEATNLMYYKHKKIMTSKTIESILDNV